MDVLKNKQYIQQTIKILNIMKTRILSFVTLAAIVLGINATSYAANKDGVKTNNNEVSTVLTNVSKINKIEVRGNVELFVIDGNADQVKVYNRYYAESALIQSQKGVLRIASYSNQKLVVLVTASQLDAISAYDNAEVKSFGKLSPIELNVTLNDNAYAKLNIDGYAASIIVNNRAKADLTGNVNECSLKYSRSASVNTTNFTATNMDKQVDGLSKNNEQEFVSL